MHSVLRQWLTVGKEAICDRVSNTFGTSCQAWSAWLQNFQDTSSETPILPLFNKTHVTFVLDEIATLKELYECMQIVSNC
jgi:hypothetical protein